MPWRCVSGGTGANCEDFVRARPAELELIALVQHQYCVFFPGSHGTSRGNPRHYHGVPRGSVVHPTGNRGTFHGNPFCRAGCFFPVGSHGKKKHPAGSRGNSQYLACFPRELPLQPVVFDIYARGNQRLIMMVLPCLLYTSPSPRDLSTSRMPSSA